MGLFSRVRRLNGAAQSAEPSQPVDDSPRTDGGAPSPEGASTPPEAVSAVPRRPGGSLGVLRDGLQQLYAMRPSREVFAEEAVKLISKSASVKAAALLGYDQRGGRLRLLGQIGLDGETLQILAGDTTVSAWDIPLRSLRNRRINVIEAAHENPFVPRALVAISPRRLTIAAVPFFHANAPIGVVVLFSPTPRGFADGLLKALSQSLRVCALGLNELPAAGAAAARREEDDQTAAAQPSLLRGLAALKAELARLTDALEESERQRAAETAERVTAQSFLRAAQDRTAALEQELADLRAGGDRLPALEAQLHGLSERLAGATEAADAARQEIERLQAAQAAGEQRATQNAATISELQTAVAAAGAARTEIETVAARLREELRTAQDQAARSEAALAQTTAAATAAERAHAEAAARHEQAQARLAELSQADREAGGLRERLQAAEHEREQRARELEQARAALGSGGQELAAATARAEALQRELEAVQNARAVVEAQLAEQRETAGRLSAERTELLARIDALSAGGESLQREREAAVNGARQRSAALEAEIARLTAALEAARTHGAEELNRTRHDATATLDGLRAELAEAVCARDELQRALAVAQQEAGTHQRAREDAAARIRTLEADVQRLRDDELAALTAQLTSERESRRLSEDAFAAAEGGYQQEIAELRERVAAFDEEQRRLARELEEKALLLQSAEEDLTAAIDLSTDAADEDSVLDIDRDCAPDGTTGGGLDVPAEVEAAAGGDCILLDGEEIAATAARQLAQFGHRVSSVAPTPDVPPALMERTVACAALNLAAPNAWALLRHLRNGGGVPRMPLVAYTLAANAPKGFWLGPVDFALLPVDQTDLVAILNRLMPSVKRVLAMSNDIDVMTEVRTQLTAARISTAVVLDGRQALDLVPTIRPEAAVLHLSPSCADVFRAIAGLRGAAISHDIPIVFLLDGEAQPREEAFITAGLRMLAGRGDLVPDALVDTLASAFEAYRAG